MPQPELGRLRAEARWARPAFVALMVVTAVLYLWDLSASGYANSFYAAAVEAGTKSWKAFFFGSIDSSSFITVDKPPGSLWIMELSGRVFGFSSWSMLAPEALAGVLSVALLYAGVRRWFGAKAGLLAGAVLAVTPVAALMFRYNNPDALLVLTLVASAYTLVRAVETGGTRWVAATGALLGFAFLVKMLQAFTVVPAFYLVYTIAAPGNLWHRARQLAICTAALVASAGWWVAIVALWPSGSRPFIDGSPDNSIINLILDYNGLGRLVSGNGGQGGGFSGATGVSRLFNDLMGGQASWLLPASVLVFVAGLVWRARAPRTDRTRAALVLWGGWLLVTGAVFSFAQGIIHTYYTVALAPAIAALIGTGAVLVWEHRASLVARALGAVGVLSTSLWAEALLERTPTFYPWLRAVVALAGSLSAVALIAAPYVACLSRPVLLGAAGLGLVACLAGPLAFTGATVTTAYTGSVPSAGPSSTIDRGFGGGPGASGGGGPGAGNANFSGGAPRPSSGNGAGNPALGGTPAGSTLPTGTGSGGAGTGSAQRPSTAPGDRAGFGASPGASAGPGKTSPVRGGSGGFGGGGPATSSNALIKALKADASSHRWVAATFGSQSAATLELASGGEPVMAIGGFNGQGGNITLAQFESYVAKGEIHYFVASGGGGGFGGGGPGGGSGNSEAAITNWVSTHFTAETIGGQTVYDLSNSPK
jgi:4-amino-4-deoxy-L-arabinose transferase-like glycosyltransferase